MLFLGYDGSNYQFMRHLNGNVVFVSPHAIFDETYFPKCPSSKPTNLEKQINEEITRHSSPDEPNDAIDLDDLFGPSYPRDPPPGPLPQPPHHHNPPSPPRPPSPRLPSPTPGPSRPKQFPQKEKPHWDKGKQRAESPPDESERPLRCSQRETKVPNRPGNVYGNKPPAKILRDYDKQPFTPGWEEQIRSRVPPRSDHQNIRVPNNDVTERCEEIRRQFDEAQERAEDWEQRHGNQLPPVPFGQNPTPSQEEDDQMEDVEALLREGGVKLNNFLFELANKIQTPVQFRDLNQLPAETRKKWIDACLEELKALQKRGVYELVDLPKG
jgi:hypothetical protein